MIRKTTVPEPFIGEKKRDREILRQRFIAVEDEGFSCQCKKIKTCSIQIFYPQLCQSLYSGLNDILSSVDFGMLQK